MRTLLQLSRKHFRVRYVDRRALEDCVGHGEVLGSNLPSGRPPRFDSCFYDAMLILPEQISPAGQISCVGLACSLSSATL